MYRLFVRSIVASGAALLVGACGPDDNDHKAKACPKTEGTICTYIGNGKAGFDGDHMPLAESRLYWPVDIEFTKTRGTFILDWNNHRVRKVLDDDTLETVMGSDFIGDGDPVQGDLVQPGVDALTIDLNHPTQVVEMPNGELLLDSWHNHKLRVFDPDTGLAYVMIGRGQGFAGDGKPIDGDTRLNQPSGVRYDKDGNLFILDQRNERIRRVKADTHVIETVVGSGDKGFEGDGGDPLLAKVAFPKTSNPQPAGSLVFDAQGRLYFSDIENNRVRMVDFVANTITTIYGDGTTAVLSNPRDLEIGPDGRLYVADERNNRIIAIDLDSYDGEVVAGTGVAGFSGDFGQAKDAQLSGPTGIGFDPAGDMYIADSLNNRIRLVRMGAQ